VICRTVEEVTAAGLREGAAAPPLTQEQVNYIAALLAPYLDSTGRIDPERCRAVAAGSDLPRRAV
jgi:hypothetical protein